MRNFAAAYTFVPMTLLRRTHLTRILLAIVMCGCAAHISSAQAQEALPQTQEAQALAPSTQDPDFVRAYIIVASEGSDVTSSMGHACLRLECPQYGHDFIFSYETDDASAHLAELLSGRFTMKLCAVPTATYLERYREEGRKVTAYPLRLPLYVKQHLWQQMDERIAAPEIPYDYMNHSCATSTLEWLITAIPPDSLDFGEWHPSIRLSRREIGENGIRSRWHTMLLTAFIGGEAYDVDIAPERKVLIPAQIVELLPHTTAYGHPILQGPPQVLVDADVPPLAINHRDAPLTFASLMAGPEWVAGLLLLLAVVALLMSWHHVPCIYFALQSLFGLLLTYMWLISSLPCTSWNYLLIPFNPLPALLWRWRRKWALPYAIVCLLWCSLMLLSPHALTAPVYVVLAMAMGVCALQLRKLSAQNQH